MLNFLFVLHGSHFWGMESRCLFLCWKYTLEQQFLSASTGHFEGWLLCRTRVSLSSCILALSLFHLRWGSPWQPRGQGQFWGRPWPCPGQARPGWPECGDSAGAGSPRVESCCQLSTTCIVSTWGLLVPFFSLSGDAVPRFFSTSYSRWNPKSITLSEKCL